MSEQHATEEQLNTLRAGFIQRLPEHLSDIKALLETISDFDKSPLQILQRKAHALASAAHTFDANIISQSAKQLEQAIQALYNTEPALDAKTIQQHLNEYISALNHQIKTYSDHILFAQNSGETIFTNDSNRLLIYSVMQKSTHAADVCTAVTTAGHFCNSYHDLSSFTAAIEQQLPDAIVMDIMFNDGTLHGDSLIQEMLAQQENKIPVIFTSEHGDIETRLRAVRAGGRRFLTHPLDFTDLVQSISGLTAHTPTAPYRILIIDDDTDIAQYHAAILNAAGCTTQILDDPMQALLVLKSYQPDLILLDVYMPRCNGLELAALIRQDNNLPQPPIVFLSSETRFRRQQDAMDIGGDDFLTKPIDPARLISVITTRIRRHRRLNRLTNDLRNTLRDKQYQQIAIDKHAIVSMTDPTGVITYVNENFCRISQYSSSELMGSNHRIIKSSKHPDEFYHEMWRTIAQGKVWQGEVCNRSKHGELYWVASTIVPFIDENNKPYQYVSIRTDITQQKQNQSKLRSANDRLDYLLTSSPVVLYSLKIHDEKLSPIWMSKNITNLLGYSVEETLEHDWWMSNVHPDDLDSVLVRNQQLFIDGHLMHEYRFKQKNGNYIWIHDQMTLQCDSADHSCEVIGAWTDITALRTIQQTLINNEERLRHSQEYANIGTWDWNIQTGDLYWSERIAPLFGHPSGTLETTYENFVNAIHPDDRQLVADAVQACIEKGVDYNIEHRCVWPDGSIHWLLERGDVVRDADGKATHMLGVVQDISNRKHAEIELLNAKEDAEQANQIKSQFLSSMSHELRTPLNAILGFAQLLEIDAEQLTDSHQEDVQEILNAGRHLLELINEVLDLAKIEAGRIELNITDIDTHSVLNECQSLVKPLLSKHYIEQFHYQTLAEPISIRADRTRLKQILINLISNAIKYNRPNGSIHIQTELRGNYLRISVIDSGKGIAADKLDQLFQPFKRLVSKDAAIEGTGIGLVITRELTELMGGHIGVESEEGVGSCFWIELPAKNTPSKENSQNSHYHLLYADQNASNLRLLTRLLSNRNDIELHTTSEPEQAIHLATEIQPHLILSEIQLPNQDPGQLFKALQTQESTRHIPIIAISTNSLPDARASALKLGFEDHISKPIDSQQLLAVIDRILKPTQK